MYIISLMKPRQNITCLLRSKPLSLYNFITTPICIYKKVKYPEKWKECESRR